MGKLGKFLKQAAGKNFQASPETTNDQTCTLCSKVGADKEWMGQWWHTKCLRKGKKAAKGML